MTAIDRRLVSLSRPNPAPDAGPLDERLSDLVERRFRRVLHAEPAFATFMGIHTEDDRLGDGSRDAVDQAIADDRSHLAAVEALDPARLSRAAAFERDLEIHNLRRVIFDLDVHRVWERRSTAMDAIGDSLFAVTVRDFAPLPERLASLASRVEAIPAFLDQHRTRARGPQVRLWQTLEIGAAGEIPGLLDDIVNAGREVAPEREQRRLEAARRSAVLAIGAYAA